MVEAGSHENSGSEDNEVKEVEEKGGQQFDLLADDFEENADEVGELFNPQEIDFNEVERLRTKVATLESLIANGANQQPSVLLSSYMETQESMRKEQAQTNQKLLQIISEL